MKTLLLIVGVAVLGACRQPVAVPPPVPLGAPVSAAAAAFPDSVHIADSTRIVFERLMARAQRESWHTRPLGEVVQTVGQHFAGAPYVAGMLDASADPADEPLRVNLCAFDCVLYVESVLALAQGIAQQDYAFDTFAARVERLRYRDGQRGGYCSRLHYFSEWIRDNARRGQVADLTAPLGGVAFATRPAFMSRHRDRYPKLADDRTFACLQAVEDTLAGHALVYLPKDRVAAVYDRLQAGDVLATATDLGDLDVTHTGFVFKHPDGRTGFMHASVTGQVKIEADLAAYLRGNRRQIGLFVARPLQPPPSGS